MHLSNNLRGDLNIMRQMKYRYAYGNKLRSNFFRRTERIKNTLFKAHCSSFYASQLGVRCEFEYFRQLRVAYNDCFCYLHGILLFCIACPRQVVTNIDMFHALFRKCLHHFVARCKRSSYRYVFWAMNSCISFFSSFFGRYNKLLGVMRSSIKTI